MAAKKVKKTTSKSKKVLKKTKPLHIWVIVLAVVVVGSLVAYKSFAATYKTFSRSGGALSSPAGTNGSYRYVQYLKPVSTLVSAADTNKSNRICATYHFYAQSASANYLQIGQVDKYGTIKKLSSVATPTRVKDGKICTSGIYRGDSQVFVRVRDLNGTKAGVNEIFGEK